MDVDKDPETQAPQDPLLSENEDEYMEAMEQWIDEEQIKFPMKTPEDALNYWTVSLEKVMT